MRCMWEKSSGSGGELAFYKYTHAVPNYTKSFPWKVRSLRLTTTLSLDLFFLSQTSQVHLDAIPGRSSGIPAVKQRYSLYSSGELPEQTLWVEYCHTFIWNVRLIGRQIWKAFGYCTPQCVYQENRVGGTLLGDDHLLGLGCGLAGNGIVC